MRDIPMGNPYNEIMGPAALYANWGLAGEACWGASGEGLQFKDNVQFRERMADGDTVPIKDAKDLLSMRPEITIPKDFRWDLKAIENSYAGMSAQTAADGKVSIYRAANITYPLTNMAIVGQTRGGVDMVIVIDNPLGVGGVELSTAKIEEITSSKVFTAHADPRTFKHSDPTTYPYHIIVEVSALTISVTAAASPLAGVVVKLSDGQYGTSADTTGIVPAMTVNKGKIGYVATKTGYVTATGEHTIDDDTEAVTIAMTAVA